MSAKETNKLLFKNLPCEVVKLNEILLKYKIPPQELKPFGRRRALVAFETPQLAQNAIHQLKNVKINEKPFYVIEFQANKKNAACQSMSKNIAITKTAHKATQTKSSSAGVAALPQINKYIQQLYACNEQYNFMQPPPPYLKYAYPRITPAIMDAICIALMSNTRFYTQVLHLMNRMNLEPPFGPSVCKFKPPGEPKHTATQTDEVAGSIYVAAASESELDSADDEAPQIQTPRNKKRKQTASQTQSESYKKKARILLSATQKQLSAASSTKTPVTKTIGKEHVFEPSSAALNRSLKIDLKPPQETIKGATEKAEDHHKESTQIGDEAASTASLAQPVQKQIPKEQLELLPIYKNYAIGVPSHKLYIKNLAKQATEQDLRDIYAQYIAAENLEIKVMQQGRMKGQAFVTFIEGKTSKANELKLDEIIAKALTDTNGLVLREKPMIVCYGKQ